VQAIASAQAAVGVLAIAYTAAAHAVAARAAIAAAIAAATGADEAYTTEDGRNGVCEAGSAASGRRRGR
jgi:hypothetical protein